MTPVPAEVVEQVRPVVPVRPEFIILYFDIQNEHWMASTPAIDEMPEELIQDIKDSMYALRIDHVHIPGEIEAVHLARRAELVETLLFCVRSIKVDTVSDDVEEIEGIVAQIDDLDAQWRKTQEATDEE